ncbi:MAG: hypothetical protein Q8941_07170 [Bacteroidota bacterium]|nr:hypothetical protein [Bacteroidota bacterium]
MRYPGYIFTVVIAISGCNSSPVKKNNPPIAIDSSEHKDSNSDNRPKTAPGDIPKTHLKDTTIAGGDFILFLRPDSARFESYAEDEDSGINEADSDFGFGISNTEDSFSKNKQYKNIKILVSEARYILIKDCKTCPLTIDRDTINYGVIISSKGRQMETIYGQVHSGDYLQEVKDYFHLKD